MFVSRGKRETNEYRKPSFASELIYLERVGEQYLSFIRTLYYSEEMCKQSFNKDAFTCSPMLAFGKKKLYIYIYLEINTHPTRVALLHTQCGHLQESACIVKCMHKQFIMQQLSHTSGIVISFSRVYSQCILWGTTLYCKLRCAQAVMWHVKTEDRLSLSMLFMRFFVH